MLTWSQWKKYSEKRYPETKITLCHVLIKCVTVCAYHDRFAWPVFSNRKLTRKKIVSSLFTLGFAWFLAISSEIPAKQSDSSKAEYFRPLTRWQKPAFVDISHNAVGCSSYFSIFQLIELKFNWLDKDEMAVSLHSQILSYPRIEEKAEELKND